MIKHFLFLKTYYKTIKKDHSKTNLNLILTMVDELDKNCDRKIFNKFKKHPYAKTFFKQKNLKEVVMQKQYKKGTLGSELKFFWQNNQDDLFHKNFNLSKTKGKKRIAFLQGMLNEHDLIHCLNRLDSTPIAELSVLAFSIAKGFRWSFFYICLSSIFLECFATISLIPCGVIIVFPISPFFLIEKKILSVLPTVLLISSHSSKHLTAYSGIATVLYLSPFPLMSVKAHLPWTCFI